ncbi:chondroitin proteoglycan 2-like [Diorhabda carinulata]|uniref:chondroitin proteoglycan 2-like n=1 Tax=Diorhabda carinulata TaxID=1163345 RepID=UPI0025A19309|nr:chondroitin proteoglycan 2-like [Diorhabda carinulata]
MSPLFLLLLTGSLYSDPDCPDSSEPTYLADPTDCSKYYECIRGQKYQGSCPDGLLWDDSHKYCDDGDYVKCYDPVCPSTEGTSNVVYPDDCSKYYKCTNGRSTILSCPENMLFNPQTNKCDYMDNVSCDWTTGRTSETSTTTTSKTTTTTKPGTTSKTTTTTKPDDSVCPSSEGTSNVVYPGDCSKYYKCIDGHSSIQSCPEAMFFNPDTKKCDYMDNVSCDLTTRHTSETSAATTSKTTTTTTPEDSVCPSSEGTSNVVYPGDCSKYYKCIDGHSSIQSCPEAMFFNPDTKKCDYMDNVSCDLTTRHTSETSAATTSKTTTTTTPANPTSIDPICPSTEGTTNVVYPDDCSKYYKCTDGHSSILSCPENMLFNPKTNKCDYMDNVSCNSTTPHTSTSTITTTSTPANPTSIDPICPSTEGTTNVVYPDDCSKYYKCTDGHSSILSCPENMLFNPKTNKCDYMDNVSCDLTTTHGSGSTTKPDSDCTIVPDGTYIEDPTNCRKYFLCIHGHGTSFSCPSGEIWDSVALTCVKSDNDC